MPLDVAVLRTKRTQVCEARGLPPDLSAQAGGRSREERGWRRQRGVHARLRSAQDIVPLSTLPRHVWLHWAPGQELSSLIGFKVLSLSFPQQGRQYLQGSSVPVQMRER